VQPDQGALRRYLMTLSAQEELLGRARVAIASCLEDVGLHGDAPAYFTDMAAHRSLGHSLTDRLAEHLAPPAYEYLRSGRMFGSGGQLFLQELPSILAFGHECGRCLHRVAGGAPSLTERVAECSAILNLGVGLLDRLTDRESDYVQGLAFLDRRRLVDLVDRREAANDLLADLEEETMSEPRVFGNVVAAFFASAQRLRALNAGSEAWQDLGKYVVGGYEAQLSSTDATALAAKAEEISRKKSVVPFEITGLIAGLPLPPARRERVMRLAHEMGEVVWRVDDLADVYEDWFTDDVNVVRIRAGRWAGGVEAHDVSELEDIIRGEHIESVACEITTHVRDILFVLDELSPPPPIRHEFKRLLLMYTLGWLT
jgi:hypothetical protein